MANRAGGERELATWTIIATSPLPYLTGFADYGKQLNRFENTTSVRAPLLSPALVPFELCLPANQRIHFPHLLHAITLTETRQQQ